VASTIACLLEANATLSSLLVRDLLRETAHFVPGADRERQGAGALSPGQAVARALAETHRLATSQSGSPRMLPEGVVFSLHDHTATSVEVVGSWNNWRLPGVVVGETGPGFWQSSPEALPPGRYAYKFLLEGHRWLDDPANPTKTPDGVGGFNSVLTVPGDSRELKAASERRPESES